MVAFLVPKNTLTYPQLVGFHLSLPIVYIDSSTYLYVTTESAIDMANTTIYILHDAPSHHLDTVAYTRYSTNTGSPTPQYEDVFLEDFISVLKCGSQERTQFTRHLFAMLEKLFRNNTPAYTHRKYPISVKNLLQGDSSWLTHNIILG